MVPVICGFLNTARQEAPGKAAVQEESQNRTYEAWLDIRYQCLKPGLCRFHRFNIAILCVYIYIYSKASFVGNRAACWSEESSDFRCVAWRSSPRPAPSKQSLTWRPNWRRKSRCAQPGMGGTGSAAVIQRMWLGLMTRFCATSSYRPCTICVCFSRL